MLTSSGVVRELEVCVFFAKTHKKKQQSNKNSWFFIPLRSYLAIFLKLFLFDWGDLCGCRVDGPCGVFCEVFCWRLIPKPGMRLIDSKDRPRTRWSKIDSHICISFSQMCGSTTWFLWHSCGSIYHFVWKRGGGACLCWNDTWPTRTSKWPEANWFIGELSVIPCMILL